MKTLIATIYGKENETQKIWIEYESIRRGGFFNPASLEVNYCALLECLEFEPSGLTYDLELAIAEAEGFHPGAVGISCEISVPNVVRDYKITEPLFI